MYRYTKRISDKEELQEIKSKLKIYEEHLKKFNEDNIKLARKCSSLAKKISDARKIIDDHELTLYGNPKKGEKGVVFWVTAFIRASYVLFGGIFVGGAIIGLAKWILSLIYG